ncbi:amino acid ABC transporter permease [Ornithinimicrobium ciconiae]|uniref:Amino acid ABC transporter permease n=1 Tax=Ornithinimicrobium ciconiae TaxID=2594265 RepID=A0A516GBZ5_9MICO|nr:amino acid ABC transporter permease [Ornithinimicrobium ciconiae]QDO88997.1 amino acid ABC transporter permease [Ornithinimicrobium ciconiae]
MTDTTRVLFDAPGPKARMRYRLMAVVGILLLAAILYVVYDRLADKGQLEAARWDWVLGASAWKNYLIPGIIDTLRAAAIAIVCASVLALALAMARMSDNRVLRWLAGMMVEFFRAVPVLVMMLFIFYFLAHRGWFPSSINPLIGVVVGLTLYNSAVLCEVIRNGVASLPSGQREAGLAIGLSPSQTRRTILIPQSLTAMLPTLVSQVIVITKDTALGYIILYPELLTRARNLGSLESATLPAYVVVAVLFILLNYALSKLAEWIENRQRRRARSAGKVGSANEPPPVAPIPAPSGAGGGGAVG